MFRQLKLLCVSFAVATAADNYPPPEALKLVEMALKNNPALASAYLSADAAHSTGEHNSAWEAPEIGVDFYQTPIGSFPNPIKNGHEIDYSVSQTIPFPGKLEAMARPHHFHGAAEASHANAMALDLRRQILSIYADLYAAEWRWRLNREDRQEIERLRAAARVGYEGGAGTQADLLRAESEEAQLDAGALEADEQRVQAKASLASLTGSGDSLMPVDNIIPSQIPMSLDSLKKTTLLRRPDLEALRREIDMARAEVTASGEEAYPDFMLSGAYKDMRDNTGGSQGFWSVGVGMKVPIAPWSWKGVRAGVDQARILERKSEQDYASLQLMAEAEVNAAVARLTSASGRLELAQGRRIPLAGQVLNSSLATYRTGKTDFSSVLTAFRELRMVREEYYTAISDHLKAWAALEWATGGALNPTTTPEGD